MDDVLSPTPEAAAVAPRKKPPLKWTQPFQVTACLKLHRCRDKAPNGSLFEAFHFTKRRKVIGQVHVFFPDGIAPPPLDTLIEVEGLVKSKTNKSGGVPYVLLFVETWKLAIGEGTGIPSKRNKWRGLPVEETFEV